MHQLGSMQQENSKLISELSMLKKHVLANPQTPQQQSVQYPPSSWLSQEQQPDLIYLTSTAQLQMLIEPTHVSHNTLHAPKKTTRTDKLLKELILASKVQVNVAQAQTAYFEQKASETTALCTDII